MSNAPLIDIRPDHLQIVQDILKKHVPDYEVWAFGSRAKWTAKEYSDLDLCVISDQSIGFGLKGDLLDDFSESDLPWKVDVVDWATTSESFRKIIEGEKVVVQTGKEGGMGSDWKWITFGDFIALQRGHDLPDQDRRPGVTIGRSGASFGVAAYTDDDYWPLNTALYVTDFKGNNPKYVYYFLSLFDFSAYNSGSAQPSLNRNNLYGIPVRVPYPFQQENIANFLTIIDDRITLLRETNATLEAIAQARMNTDAAVPGLNRNNVYRLTAPIPGNDLLSVFDGVVDTIRHKIFHNKQLSKTLTSIRDTLLPRLISGQLRLPEAEAS